MKPIKYLTKQGAEKVYFEFRKKYEKRKKPEAEGGLQKQREANNQWLSQRSKTKSTNG